MNCVNDLWRWWCGPGVSQTTDCDVPEPFHVCPNTLILTPTQNNSQGSEFTVRALASRPRTAGIQRLHIQSCWRNGQGE